MKPVVLPELEPPMAPISAADALAEALQHLAFLEGATADLGVSGDAWAAARAMTEARKALPIIRALHRAQRGY